MRDSEVVTPSNANVMLENKIKNHTVTFLFSLTNCDCQYDEPEINL